MKFKNYYSLLLTATVVMLLSSCSSSSVTNVWDYYVTNEVVQHRPGETAVSYRKLLYQEVDKTGKSQLDMIMVKQDSTVTLVLGSYKMSALFVIKDSTYAFGLNDLYSRDKGDDLVGKAGDLTVFFTQIPASKCIEFLDSAESFKRQFTEAKVTNKATTHLDFYFSSNVFMSIDKDKQNDGVPSKCTLWVGRRKHILSIKEFARVLNEVKNFN